MNCRAVMLKFGSLPRICLNRLYSSASELPKLSSINVKEERKGVFNVEINRPKSRNSLTLDVWKELKVAFEYLDKHSACRSIVLTGNGQTFCSGIDLKEGITSLFQITADSSLDVSRKAFYLNDRILEAQSSFNSIENCKKPVIAVIQGHCFGAGISMISCVDIRYSVEDAQFSIKEPDVGLAADVGILQRLEKIAGNASWAREIAFTARSFSGTEALKNGLVSRTFANKDLCLSSAIELASEIASKSPVTIYGTKLAMNYARDHTTHDSLEWIRIHNAAHLQTEDMQKIAKSMMEKKKPEFNDVYLCNSKKMLNTGKFAQKTLIISGGSRGIGRSIALKLAKDGANVAILAKTAQQHATLPGTIYSVAEEIEKAGGRALPIQCDVRDEHNVREAVEETVKKFGGIDIVCNNASAISLTGTLDTEMKRYDLMHSINTRGTFLLSKLSIPYLKQSKNPHILNMSPPLLMDKLWFGNHVAYTMAKYGMSMCVLGMHEEFRSDGIAVNALWPRSAIWTAAVRMFSGSDESSDGYRIPEIVADAAYAMLSRNSKQYTGNFAIDEDILKEEGVIEFDQYACKPGAPIKLDLFIPGSNFEAEANPHKKSRDSIKSQDLHQSIESLKKLLRDDEEVKKLGTVYDFRIKDSNNNVRSITVDLSKAKLSEGEAEKADVVFELDAATFVGLLDGTLRASDAFVGQKLKIRGNIVEAMKLEKALKKLHKK